MGLPSPSKSYLVLKWVCSSCTHVNYAEPKMLDPSSEKAIADAADLGCEPSELATVADVLCCRKCETSHSMTNFAADGI